MYRRRPLSQLENVVVVKCTFTVADTSLHFAVIPSQRCILAPQGPHAVLLVSAWARVCVLGS